MLIRRLDPDAAELDSEGIENLYFVGERRHLRVNFVQSIDGAVELEGRSRGLGGPSDREVFMALRAVSDVVIVGAGTVRAERYGPVRLNEDRQQRRVRRGQSPIPPLAIVTNHADLDPESRLFETGGGDILVLTTSEVADGLRGARLPGTAEVIGCGTDTVDLGEAIKALSDRGLDRVLCEGGPTLTRSLLEEGLVDEMCLTLSPVIAGAGHRRLLGDEPLLAPVGLRLSSLFESDGLLIARYVRA